MINVSASVPKPLLPAPMTPVKALVGEFRQVLDGLGDALPPPPADALRDLAVAKDPAVIRSLVGTEQPQDSLVLDPAPGRLPAKRIDTPNPDSTICRMPALAGKRQTPAADGKTLPADRPDEDVVKDPLWMPMGAVLPAPAPASRAPTSAGPSTGVALAIDGAAPPISHPVFASPAKAGAQSGDGSDDSLAQGDWTPASAGEAGEAVITPVANDVVTSTVAGPALATVPDLPLRVDIAALSAPLSHPRPSMTLPAGQAFAAAIADPSDPAFPAKAGVQSLDVGDSTLAHRNWAPASAGEVQGAVAVSSAKDTVAKPTFPALETGKRDMPLRVDTAAPPVAPPSPSTTLPAGQAFAAAIAAVQQHRDAREPVETRAPLTVAAFALESVHTPAILPAADAQHAALDLHQDSGLQGMIDHIEVLRDGADANDTRIRLVPDALGAVDVSVRKDGERVHVHFAAENQASARLLADAQPRLAELAEARGVKLGQTSVDSGHDSQRRQQPAQPVQSARPVAASDPIDTPDDLRLNRRVA